MKKLWLDDIRLAPDGYYWAKSVAEAVLWLEGRNITQEEIEVSFCKTTGYLLARYIEGCASSGKIFNVVKWSIHSTLNNPIGADNIKAAMQSFEQIRLKAIYEKN